MEFKKNNIMLKYWKTIEEVNDDIKKYLNEKIDNIYIFNKDKLYCSKCLKELNENYCENCRHYYILNNIDKVNTNDEFKFNNYYFAFSVINNKVFLYEISYKSHINFRKLFIKNIYLVKKEGLFSILDKEFVLFSDYVNQEKKKKLKIDISVRFESLRFSNGNTYLYTENIEDLKKTEVYKYSYIWLGKEYLNKENDLSLMCITLRPLLYKQFEYLMKFKLYNLAVYSSEHISKGKTFKEIFGVEKSHLKFMQENNIDIWKLDVLRCFPMDDLNVINFYCKCFKFVIKKLSDLVNLKDLMLYLNNEFEMLNQYIEYIRSISFLGMNTKNKKILFPKNLVKACCNTQYEVLMIKDKHINERVLKLSKKLKVNIYENNKYIIYPADSIESLIDESIQQSNCVRRYCLEYSNNSNQIYFMREKSNIHKSFITIQVIDNKISQAYRRFNKEPNEKELNVLKEWESKLKSVSNN